MKFTTLKEGEAYDLGRTEERTKFDKALDGLEKICKRNTGQAGIFINDIWKEIQRIRESFLSEEKQ